MNFLIDAQLPPALASWLREQGHEADHVADLDLSAAADSEVATRAADSMVILISKDADFVRLRLPDRFALVWLRCGNATNRALREWLLPRWPQVMKLLGEGERFIEVQ